VLYYFLSLFSSFALLYSLLLIVALTYDFLYCCVISAFVIQSCKIPVFPCYLAYRGSMYAAIVSIKVWVSKNEVNKCVLMNRMQRETLTSSAI
jgi:hypothetical protein